MIEIIAVLSILISFYLVYFLYKTPEVANGIKIGLECCLDSLEHIKFNLVRSIERNAKLMDKK